MEINYLAVVVAAIAAFVLSGVWYAAFGRQLARLHDAYAGSGRPAAATVVVELVRNVVLATVVAGLADRLGVDGGPDAVVLGLVLWVGFPVLLLTGSVFHERVPPKLAAIHAGDWLVKLLAVAVIVGVWR